MPALPVVAIPHPLLGIATEQIYTLASQATEQLVRLFTTPAQQLEAEFAGWFQIGGDTAVTCDEVGCMPVYFATRR